jgi:elongation factor 1-alpha
MSETEGKTHVSIVICGHVDAGKSTTTGRLIFELGGISERDVEKLKAEADAVGKSSFYFAFYMDRQKDERERGVTIACTTKQFFTATKHYTVIDAPGHRDFIKNMISGASQADVALLVAPADGNFPTAIQKADHGTGAVPGQTRQHAVLINLLGVKQVIVGINKMDCDLAGYKEERFVELREEMRHMLAKVGYKKNDLDNTLFLPMSGWKGDNLLTKSKNMAWWKGQDLKVTQPDGSVVDVHVDTLVDALEKMVYPPVRDLDRPLRCPISGQLNIKGVGSVFTGRVEQGSLKPKDQVIFLPTHTKTNKCAGSVFSIEMHHRSSELAGPGDNVGVNVKLDKGNASTPHKGDIMIRADDNSLKACDTFEATVQVLTIPAELKVGYCPIGFVRTAKEACRVEKILWKMGKDTGGKKVENPDSIKSADIAHILWKPTRPFVVDKFSNCAGLGRIAFFEGGSVVMLGKVLKVTFKDT